jgi:hypothetical protein
MKPLHPDELLAYCRRKELEARATAAECRRLGGDAAAWMRQAEHIKNARTLLEVTLRPGQDSFDRFWRTTEGAGPAERRVIAEFHKLTRAQQYEEAVEWLIARLDAMLTDCAVPILPAHDLENPS